MRFAILASMIETRMSRFKDRKKAGQELAKRLAAYRAGDGVVYALPRGGVVLGVEVAKALGLPLDLVIARKIGAPEHEEYAVAAIAEDGDLVVAEAEVGRLDPAWFAKACEEQKAEAKRRRLAYLGDRPSPDVRGKTAIVVDDGIATGLTMKAVLKEIRHKKPSKIVLAVPVTSPEAEAELTRQVDAFIAIEHDLTLGAIGASYEDFPQVSDEEVTRLMKTV